MRFTECILESTRWFNYITRGCLPSVEIEPRGSSLRTTYTNHCQCSIRLAPDAAISIWSRGNCERDLGSLTNPFLLLAHRSWWAESTWLCHELSCLLSSDSSCQKSGTPLATSTILIVDSIVRYGNVSLTYSEYQNVPQWSRKTMWNKRILNLMIFRCNWLVSGNCLFLPVSARSCIVWTISSVCLDKLTLFKHMSIRAIDHLINEDNLDLINRYCTCKASIPQRRRTDEMLLVKLSSSRIFDKQV